MPMARDLMLTGDALTDRVKATIMDVLCGEEIEDAPKEIDMRENADLIFRPRWNVFFKSGQIIWAKTPCRISTRTRSRDRYGDAKYERFSQQFTIRKETAMSGLSELSKVTDGGFGDLNFYCWFCKEELDALLMWTLSDLSVFRKYMFGHYAEYGFYPRAEEVYNGDGSNGLAYKYSDVSKAGPFVVAAGGSGLPDSVLQLVREPKIGVPA